MKDKFNRNITYMRLSITELCNLRCRYCMPEDGICKKSHDEMLSEEEMLMAIETGAKLGIKKLRITGGEPLVKKNLLSICKKAKAVKGIEEVCLTTNGLLLKECARELVQAGVSRVNISLDTLKPEKYEYITRFNMYDKAMEGLKSALEAGFEKVKINTVLIGGFNDDEIKELAYLTKNYPVDVRFIELMPMYDGGDFGPDAYISYKKVLEVLPELKTVENDGGVAKLYRLPGAYGNIGLISPVSEHFCSECNRIRLTADGKLKPCLHSKTEYNIKGLGRQEMKSVFEEAIYGKPQKHEVLTASKRSNACRNMNQIGG